MHEYVYEDLKYMKIALSGIIAYCYSHSSSIIDRTKGELSWGWRGGEGRGGRQGGRGNDGISAEVKVD